MVFVYAVVLVLAHLQNASADNNAPSFRSSWHEGGKPILRGGGPQNEDETDPSNENKEKSDVLNLEWVKDLRSGISELVHELGYDEAKPFIERLVDDTEQKQKVLLHVEVNRDGKSKVDFKQYLRSSSANRQMVWPPTPPPAPQWLVDFKAFIKNLIERYGKNHLDDHLRPVIKYVEKLNNVYINDIDVDEFGEVIVDYVEKQRPFDLN